MPNSHEIWETMTPEEHSKTLDDIASNAVPKVHEKLTPFEEEHRRKFLEERWALNTPQPSPP